MQQEVDVGRTHIRFKADAIEARFDTLDASVETLSSSFVRSGSSDLSGQITDLSSSLSNVQDSLATAHSDITALTTRVTTLESTVTSGSNAATAAGRVNANGTLHSGYNMSSVHTSTGNYTITFDVPLANDDYAVMIQPIGTSNDTPAHIAEASITPNGFNVRLGEGDNGGGAEPGTNRALSVIVISW